MYLVQGRGRSRSVSGGSSSDVSGSDLNRSAVGTTSEDDEVRRSTHVVAISRMGLGQTVLLARGVPTVEAYT